MTNYDLKAVNLHSAEEINIVRTEPTEWENPYNIMYKILERIEQKINEFLDKANKIGAEDEARKKQLMIEFVDQVGGKYGCGHEDYGHYAGTVTLVEPVVNVKIDIEEESK